MPGQIPPIPSIHGDKLLPELEYPYDRSCFTYEQEVVNPALEAKGFKILCAWYSPEKDSFGPLSRAVRISGGEGEVEVFYA